jgi:hypothetical protein
LTKNEVELLRRLHRTGSRPRQQGVWEGRRL